MYNSLSQQKPVHKMKRTPLELFFAKSLKMARSRNKMKGMANDDNVTVAYLVGLFHGQNGLCFFTGEPMTLERGLVTTDGKEHVRHELCTMDRINNRMGYDVGNINLTCDGINRMRGNMSMPRFQSLCRKIGVAA